ncbi:putative ferric-chelate reductase 1 [Discoglossus pictus]
MEHLFQSSAIFLGTLFFLQVSAYPDGKVEEACVSMSPNHGSTAQTSPAPYSLSVSKTSYTKGEKITVTLTNTSSLQMEGLMIQARAGNSATPVGYFEVSSATLQTLKCTTDGSTVSHSSNTKKSNVQVTWVAPNSNMSDIKIRATVVKNTTLYWENVLSEKLIYAGSGGSQLLVPTLGHLLLSSTLLTCALLAL